MSFTRIRILQNTGDMFSQFKNNMFKILNFIETWVWFVQISSLDKCDIIKKFWHVFFLSKINLCPYIITSCATFLVKDVDFFFKFLFNSFSFLKYYDIMKNVQHYNVRTYCYIVITCNQMLINLIKCHVNFVFSLRIFFFFQNKSAIKI